MGSGACRWVHRLPLAEQLHRVSSCLGNATALVVSPGVAALSPATSSIILGIVGNSPPARWTVHAAFESFNARPVQLARQKRLSMVFGLATKRDINDMEDG